MSKTKLMALQCLGVFLAFMGVWWWTGREYQKTHPIKQEWKAIGNPVKIYKGIWHKKGYLEVIK